jgi:predicted RNase H-like HicB family nuclease
LHNEFTAVFERDGDWVIAYCPEIPGANGQGRTKDEARASLVDAIALILDDRRTEIPNVLANKICRNLGVPEPGSS